MTGYFQRLSQQTGLHIGSGGDPKSGSRRPSFTGSKQVGEITPLDVEETRVIKPQQLPRIERRAKVENIPESAPAEFEGQIEGETPIPSADETKTADPAGMAREHRPEKEGEIQPAPEQGGMKDRAIEETFTKSEMVESELSDKEEIQRHDDSSVPSVTIKQPTFKGGKDPEDRPGDEAGRQPTLMEVREWLAETPDAEFEEIESHKNAKETAHTGEIESSEPVAHGDFSIASRPEIVAYPAGVEPETNDFQLSIGTIHITIEEPQKQVPEKRPQKEFQVGESQKQGQVKESYGVAKQRKSAPKAQQTRLARHYIRI